jgi:hypothetical protein
MGVQTISKILASEGAEYVASKADCGFRRSEHAERTLACKCVEQYGEKTT